MIRVTVGTGPHPFLHIRGHAGFAASGSDIVCAGVSAVAFALLGYLARCDPGCRVSERPGELTVQSRGGEKALRGFEMAAAGLALIARKYPENVTILPPIHGDGPSG